MEYRNCADDAVFVFGGYSREKTAGSATAGNSKAASSKSEGKIHSDMWMLSLRGLLGSGGGGLQRLDPTKATWQKVCGCNVMCLVWYGMVWNGMVLG